MWRRALGPPWWRSISPEEDDVVVDHETLRRWMLAAGLWTRVRRRSPHRQRRARKAHSGDLFQLDGSFHRSYVRLPPFLIRGQLRSWHDPTSCAPRIATACCSSPCRSRRASSRGASRFRPARKIARVDHCLIRSRRAIHSRGRITGPVFFSITPPMLPPGAPWRALPRNARLQPAQSRRGFQRTFRFSPISASGRPTVVRMGERGSR
jgi:hypothetical protein